MTRSQKSFLNFISDTFSTLLIIGLNFITRSVFIRTLGMNYQGLEGIFSSILSVLSLAELGFGSAIVFKLYKPLEEQDHARLQVLMKLYRKTYFIIGCVIAGVGLCLIPALPFLAPGYKRLESLGLNAVYIFLLYLFNSASSYWFFAYKSSLVRAAQKSYILTVVGYAVNIGGSIAQILVLEYTRRFDLYVVALIVPGLIANLVYAYICDKCFPFLKEKTDAKLSKEEVRDFFKDCSALFLYRISNTLIGSSDNIVISSMLGLHTLGIYTTYYAVRSNLQNAIYTFNSAIQASIGSIYSTGKLEWSRLVFRTVNFCSAWLYGVGAIGLAVLSNEFMMLWLHNPEYIVTSWTTASGVTIATPVALFLGIETYISGQKYYCGSFREAMGLFRELRFRPVASVIINLFFSILLAPRLGMAACLISTIISALTTNLIFDPLIIHRKALKCSPTGYFIRNILYKLVVAAAGIVCWWLCGLIPLGGIPGFIVRGCVCVAVPSIIFVVCFWRTTEFRFVLNTALDLVRKKTKQDPAGTDEGETSHDA